MTNFTVVYDKFLGKITDDMFMELTMEDTSEMLQELLLDAIPLFEFPRVNLFEYQLASDSTEANPISEDAFPADLTNEEINILASYMVVQWVGIQLASVENTRQKYSGSDFKFTSQANHLAKLIELKKKYETESFHLQRLYKRRKVDKDGKIVSTFDQIMEVIK